MKRRIAAFLLVLAAVFGAGAADASPAAASDGLIGTIVEIGCDNSAVGLIGRALDTDWCTKAGKTVDKAVKEEWDGIWKSTIGDWLKAAIEMYKALIAVTLTIALRGPSLKLENTGLWSGNTALAGMMTWFGLLISAFGFMWQAGRMAVTGQAKHLWRAAGGWAQNTMLCFCGVWLVSLLLAAGDLVTDGAPRARSPSRLRALPAAAP